MKKFIGKGGLVMYLGLMFCIVSCTVGYEGYFLLLLLLNDSLLAFQLQRISECMNHEPKLRETDRSFKNVLFMSMGV